jgi:hypothetical protein
MGERGENFHIEIVGGMGILCLFSCGMFQLFAFFGACINDDATASALEVS